MTTPAIRFDGILETVWPRVRRKHLYPELPHPIYSEETTGSGLRIQSKRILLSRHFIEKLASAIPPRKCVEALLDHAVSRYLYCPWNLVTYLKLYGETRKLIDSRQAAYAVTEAFIEIAANTRCISRVDSPLPTLYSALCGDGMTELIKGVLQQLWKYDMGISGDHPAIAQLTLIPYLDRSQWITGIQRFARLLLPYLDRDRLTDSTNACLTPSQGLEAYSPEEISAGLKELAAWVETPAEFTRIVEEFGIETDGAPAASENGAGTGKGYGQANAEFYYMKLAENYRLPIRRMPLVKSGATYPHHHVAWEIGQPCFDIDPWTSFGKIMPGITQVWQRQESEIFARKERIPELLVMIDSSSSMRHPARKLSYAVLGAGCACDAYLRNGARVAVYNFSDAAAGGKQMLSWSRNRTRVFQTLCHYIGGGTKIVLEDLKDWQMDPPPDIFLITDLQIINLSILVDYFNTCSNRVTVVHMGPNVHVSRFLENAVLQSDLSIFGIEKREDILKIVLGKVREYLGSGFL